MILVDIKRIMDLSKSKPKQREINLKKCYMGFLHLVDAWRIKNLNSRDYTFFSDRHQTYLRINLS